MTEPAPWLNANRAHWDERVPIHAGGGFYDVEAFIAAGPEPPAFQRDAPGDVAGRTLVHPQCHIGLDTIAWARLGARITGLDFSGPAIATARDVARRAGVAAEFVEANVYDAVAALGGRRFDIVYTGIGAINWLPDLRGWAEVMARLLAPGGTFYLVEFHPLTMVFADDDLTLAHPYFDDGPRRSDEPGSYADLGAETVHNETFEWQHGLGDVVSALIDAGMRIDALREHDFTYWQRWPFLELSERGYVMPADRPSLPLTYSLRATGAP